MPPLPNADEAHVVPSGYWKVVAIGGRGGVAAAVGFVMDQDLPRSADFCDAENRIGIKELEHRVGIGLFPGLDPIGGDESERQSADLARRLGCEN